MLKQLTKIANKLDLLGEYDLANELDTIMSEAGDSESLWHFIDGEWVETPAEEVKSWKPQPKPEPEYSDEESAEFARMMIGSLVKHEGGKHIGDSDGNRIFRFDSEDNVNKAKDKVNDTTAATATVTKVGGGIWDLELKMEKKYE